MGWWLSQPCHNAGGPSFGYSYHRNIYLIPAIKHVFPFLLFILFSYCHDNNPLLPLVWMFLGLVPIILLKCFLSFFTIYSFPYILFLNMIFLSQIISIHYFPQILTTVFLHLPRISSFPALYSRSVSSNPSRSSEICSLISLLEIVRRKHHIIRTGFLIQHFKCWSNRVSIWWHRPGSDTTQEWNSGKSHWWKQCHQYEPLGVQLRYANLLFVLFCPIPTTGGKILWG